MKENRVILWVLAAFLLVSAFGAVVQDNDPATSFGEALALIAMFPVILGIFWVVWVAGERACRAGERRWVVASMLIWPWAFWYALRVRPAETPP